MKDSLPDIFTKRKDSLPDIFTMRTRQFRPKKATESRERSDRRWKSIKEGWDVSGPRWRIGWGGLDDDEVGEEATHPRHRH
jgi:hypothetical protein